MAASADSIVAVLNTRFAPTRSHRTEEISSEAAKAAVKIPCTTPACVALICHSVSRALRQAG